MEVVNDGTRAFFSQSRIFEEQLARHAGNCSLIATNPAGTLESVNLMVKRNTAGNLRRSATPPPEFLTAAPPSAPQQPAPKTRRN